MKVAISFIGTNNSLPLIVAFIVPLDLFPSGSALAMYFALVTIIIVAPHQM